MKLSKHETIVIGKLGQIIFSPGWYAYVGSAMNNIEKRVKRHLSDKKRYHWHIDYFLEHAQIKKVFYKNNNIPEECDIANMFFENIQSIPGFGSSDCRCVSHLFHGNKKEIEKIVAQVNMNVLNISTQHN
jgi:Uri superfamily endonuclease